MPKLVILITPRLEEGHSIGDAWQQAGAPGVTFVESYGLRRLQETSDRPEVLPGMMSMLEILRSGEDNNVMLFSVVPDERVIDEIIKVTEAIIGNIALPDNGILFTLDVDRALGRGLSQPSQSET